MSTPASADLVRLAGELTVVGRQRVGRGNARLPGGAGHLELVYWHPRSRLGTTIRVPLHPKAAYEAGMSTARLNAARIIQRDLMGGDFAKEA